MLLTGLPCLGLGITRLDPVTRVVMLGEGMRQGTDDGESIGDPRMSGHQLVNAEAFEIRGDGTKRPADLGWCFGLHVPEVDVRGTARHPEENAGRAVSACGNSVAIG